MHLEVNADATRLEEVDGGGGGNRRERRRERGHKPIGLCLARPLAAGPGAVKPEFAHCEPGGQSQRSPGKRPAAEHERNCSRSTDAGRDCPQDMIVQEEERTLTASANRCASSKVVGNDVLSTSAFTDLKPALSIAEERTVAQRNCIEKKENVPRRKSRAEKKELCRESRAVPRRKKRACPEKKGHVYGGERTQGFGQTKRVVKSRWKRRLVDKCVHRPEARLVRLRKVAADAALGWDAWALDRLNGPRGRRQKPLPRRNESHPDRHPRGKGVGIKGNRKAEARMRRERTTRRVARNDTGDRDANDGVQVHAHPHLGSIAKSDSCTSRRTAPSGASGVTAAETRARWAGNHKNNEEGKGKRKTKGPNGRLGVGVRSRVDQGARQEDDMSTTGGRYAARTGLRSDEKHARVE
ncbi:hypothetical protein C8F04DRAFT_1173049 [Mycena alexandri]|uniref:Uncharacterized protein n=1 Tax=Mycena alexandri TaxID=1745969 RepID=A0AAD6XF90_9AGAR|nr:hypothetical protein C8F04DRAFT_1173049 [Mycena alexandri]